MKLKKTISVDDIMKLGPCYLREEIQEFWNKYQMPKRATVLQVAESGHEKIDDIFWLLLRPEYIPERELHLFACWCAERALKNERKEGREPHRDCWRAIKTKRQWLDGKASDEELASAMTSAEALAEASAWASVWVAEASARTSAEASARASVWAAGEAARTAQLKQLIRIIKKINQE